ncbi:hypothetical protein V6N13_093346 [Hibiscus sabdariffa]|uniref:Uncharacterized protein n=1 Tax=Hibiscus sabdariffa TaxID=183260 RepID=A0ABR2BMN7_9ROSI
MALDYEDFDEIEYDVETDEIEKDVEISGKPLIKDELSPKPASVTHVEASAIPFAVLTAWHTLIRSSRITKGQRLLVISGAVGPSLQIAVVVRRSWATEEAPHKAKARWHTTSDDKRMPLKLFDGREVLHLKGFEMLFGVEELC